MKSIFTTIIILLIGGVIGMIIRDATINQEEQLFKCQEELEISNRILENPHHCVSVCSEVFGVED